MHELGLCIPGFGWRELFVVVLCLAKFPCLEERYVSTFGIVPPAVGNCDDDDTTAMSEGLRKGSQRSTCSETTYRKYPLSLSFVAAYSPYQRPSCQHFSKMGL